MPSPSTLGVLEAFTEAVAREVWGFRLSLLADLDRASADPTLPASVQRTCAAASVLIGRYSSSRTQALGVEI